MNLSPKTLVYLLLVALVLVLGVALWRVQHRQEAQSVAESVPAPPPVAPSGSRVIYSETADPRADIQQALATAAKEHKRVILDFGGNWCGDCQVLDIYFHDGKNRNLLESNYVLVHVDIGHMDENTDVAEKYDVPLAKGVPALAVLESNGNLLPEEWRIRGDAAHGRSFSDHIPQSMEANRLSYALTVCGVPCSGEHWDIFGERWEGPWPMMSSLSPRRPPIPQS